MSIVGGTQSLVNSTTTEFQGNVSITGLAGGGWVTAWQSYGQDGSDAGVYQQRYDSSGVKLGGETLVNTNTYLDQAEPSIAGLDGGGWVVSWMSYYEYYSGWNVYQQAYDADGNKVGLPRFLESGGNAAVAGLSDGGWITTWDNWGYSVRFQTFSETGTAEIGYPASVDQYYSYNPTTASSVAPLADGGWVITCTGTQSGSGTGSEVFQQRYDAAGNAVGPTLQKVNSTTAGNQNGSAVAAFDDGGWVVVWASVTQNGEATNVYMQRYDGSGNAVGGETLVNTTVSGDQSVPSVAVLPNSSWVVVWQGNGVGDEAGIYQQVYRPSGTPIGGEYLVNTTTAGSQSGPVVAALEDGSWVASWNGSGDEDSQGVYQRSFTSVNGVPVVASAIVDQAATQDATFRFELPADTFADIDVGDTLTLSATLANGDPLPVWLTFDPATRTFSGTPENDHVGSITVKLTATDGYGASVSDSFEISVTNVNDAPVVANAIVDQAATQDVAFSFQIPSDAFADIDVGDTLSYVAKLASGDPLPAWLTFDADTRTFAGTPENDHVGAYSITVTAEDVDGKAVSDTFTITVANVNDAPVVASAIVDQAATQDATFRFELPADTFADIDVGDTLTLSATLANGDPLPVWLTFDPATRTFSGTPENDHVGSITVKVTATDGDGASVSDSLEISVANVNDAPVATGSRIATTEDTTYRFKASDFGFSDIDGDDLAAIIISDLASKGVLRIGDEVVSAGRRIDAEDIGLLSWTPPKDGNGKGLAKFSFRVADDGGTENGGIDISSKAAQITFDVVEVVDSFIGGKGNQNLVGTAGADILSGGKGNDKLKGDDGVDTFFFKTGFDRDIIRDFKANGADKDRLDLSGLKSVTDFNDLMKNHLDVRGDDIWIDGGRGDVVILQNVKLKHLDADDFLF
jgi:hypothetical protein